MNNPITYIFTMLVFVASTAAAVVRVDGNTLTISGNTTRMQSVAVVNALKYNDIKRVRMWGSGGDFFSGLSIGYALSQEDVDVIIPTGARCVSACAFAALGAKKVFLGGELWFHKPFKPRYSTVDRLEDIDRAGQNIGINLSYYIWELDHPIRFLFEVIGSTSHCKYVVISKTSSIRDLMSAGFDDKPVYSRKTQDDCVDYSR